MEEAQTVGMKLTTAYPEPDAEKFNLGRPYRLRKALNHSGVKVSEMAEHLEVSPNSVTNWINGHAWPRRRDLAKFALRTGYPIEWLETGELPKPRPNGYKSGGSRRAIVNIADHRGTPVRVA